MRMALGRTQIFVRNFIKRWREERATAAIERAHFERAVDDFVAETKPLMPAAPNYPEAALYRYAWKRAVALELIYKERSDESRALFFGQVQKRVGSAYYAVAPTGPYGKARLRMEAYAINNLKHAELGRMSMLFCTNCRAADDPGTAAQIRSPVDCPRCGARYTSGVYILSNAAMPRLVKIGHTTKSLSDRIGQLSALTAVPMPFELEAWFPCEPRLARRYEQALHDHFVSSRVPS